MSRKRKRHIERRAPSNILFAYEPAICGREIPGYYGMYVIEPDWVSKFFAEPRRATCETCRRMWKDGFR